MERRYLNLFSVIFLAIFPNANIIYAQNQPTTWQEQLEYAKNSIKEKKSDEAYLNIVDYTYKGVIGSEIIKCRIIDSLLSYNAPAVLRLPPEIIRDTIIKGDSCMIHERFLPKFEIISFRKVLEVADSLGKENFIEVVRKQLNDLIKIDYEYLVLEWSYKGDRFKSIGIVSNKHGGFVYEPIAFNILTENSITTMVREKGNSQ